MKVLIINADGSVDYGDDQTIVAITQPNPGLVDRLTKALISVRTWADQRCPCHNETPDPCPLCGASVANLEACKAADNTFPRWLKAEIDAALAATKRN